LLITIIALSTIPALLYTFIERGIFGWNTTVLGARYGFKIGMSDWKIADFME
jgi:hypothetical protein